MALQSGSLGTLLQGVSQQPDRVRLSGQVTEQVNLISDVTLGLSTRPSTNEGSVLDRATSEHKFQEISFAGEDLIVGYKPDDVQLWTLDGQRKNLGYRNGGDASYVGSDMQFHVVEGKIVLLNRDTVVRIGTDPLGVGWNAAVFHALGGQFLKTYTVNVTFSDGSTVSTSYTTPDGTRPEHAQNTTSEFIITRLAITLRAHPNLPAGTIVTRAFDVALVYHQTLQMSISVSDGEGGEILRGVSNTVGDISDLPRFAPNGMVAKVVSSDAIEDDFWLKFVANDVVTEDGAAGFGIEGVWTEWYDPDAPRTFDLETMPHVLVQEPNGFFLEQGPWAGRAVGDADSAPYVSILDKRIRDIEGFEGRLALLSTDTVIMSRTNEPFDLWRESATLVAATDPIDITSTKKDDLVLDWFVPFDRDLFIMSDPGDSQFVIRGGGIDPTSVSMVLTTEFEVASGGVAPTSTGRTILFPFKAGAFSGIKEFYTDSDSAANAANTLTETQDRYIIGDVTSMAISQNFNTGLFLASGESRSVWVYKYLWDGVEVLQSAWSKWSFQDDVHHVFFRGNSVVFVGSNNGVVFLHSLDLNRPLGEFGFHVMLDRQITRQVVNGSVLLPYKDARFLQSTQCAYPGRELSPESATKINASLYRYDLDSELAPDGATLHCGQTVDWTLVPSEVYVNDHQARIDTSRKITIQDYVVHVDNSGEFTAVGSSPYSDDWTYALQSVALDNEPLFDDVSLTYTGASYVPWGERADWSTLTLTGTDIRPVTILEIEWNGQILQKKGRRI